jgi:hypothetical protein
MSGTHASDQLIERYAAGGQALAALSAEQEWTLEAHLETCVECQQRLAQSLATQRPQLGEILDVVWQDIAVAATSKPAPVRSRLKRWLLTWASPSLLPWLAMTALVVLAALGFDVASRTSLPSLVVLLAPVMPLLGVAASWTRRMDPMYELIAGAPRAGLSMVLRRTAAVLVVVIPMLAIAAVLADGSPVLWLLPCLAFTLGTLALGTVTGVARAAGALAVLWALAVVIPSLATSAVPVLLQPVSLPGWLLAAAVAAVILHRRAPACST